MTYTVALESDAVFDRSSFRTNVGGGADPHASQNSFSVPVNDVAAPARCTSSTNYPLPGCVWITGSSPVRESGNVTFADPPGVSHKRGAGARRRTPVPRTWPNPPLSGVERPKGV